MTRQIRTAAVLCATLAAGIALAACQARTEPPGDTGVCYNVIPQKDGKLKYFKVVNTNSLESCAANLEAMRIKFLRMGGTRQEIYGAFQSNFLFLVAEGVQTSQSLEGPRYLALVRTGDGRLAVPGAMPTPRRRRPCRTHSECLWTVPGNREQTRNIVLAHVTAAR